MKKGKYLAINDSQRIISFENKNSTLVIFVKIFSYFDHLINTLLSRFETLEFYQIERGHQLNNQNDHEYIQRLDVQSAESTGL